PPDRCEQHRVGAATRVEHLVGERGAMRVDARAAEEVLFELELTDGAQDLERRRHDLRPDPVPGQRHDARWHARERYRTAGAIRTRTGLAELSSPRRSEKGAPM